jgi:hypothetical protein
MIKGEFRMNTIYVVMNYYTPIRAYDNEDDAIDFIISKIIKSSPNLSKRELLELFEDGGIESYSVESYSVCKVPLEEVQ